jgi:hypothetical protein
MCMGQFYVTDPRCVNYGKDNCIFCGAKLNTNWAEKEAQKDHKKTCPMYLIWEEK